MFLNDNQRAYMEEIRAQTVRDRRRAWFSLVLATLAVFAIFPLAWVDWEVLLFIHSSYASAGYAASAFAAAGLIAALSVAKLEAGLGRIGKLIVYAATAIAALFFVIGIAVMFAAISYSQGLGQLGEALPDINLIFSTAVEAVPDADIGPDWLEMKALDIAKPLFLIAIACGFILTTTLIAACVGFVFRTIGKACATIFETRHVIRQSDALRAAYEDAIKAAEVEARLQERAANWKDHRRFADLLSGILHQHVDGRQRKLDHYRAVAPSDVQPVPGIPVAPDGTMPMDVVAEEGRLSAIREGINADRIFAALGSPTIPALPRSLS